ncbi:MAG: hypothetical protein PUB10_08410 [Clostridiales bacterium]|nr:hypothetical protein [Clostridiales bacterium]
MWLIGIIVLLVIFILISKRKKYTRIICLIGITVLMLGYICNTLFRNFGEPIGQISGLEMDVITIDGCVYEADYNNDYSINDRDKYLGKVVTYDAEVSFRVYSVKGTDEYIYCLWDWEGAIYKKTANAVSVHGTVGKHRRRGFWNSAR